VNKVLVIGFVIGMVALIECREFYSRKFPAGVTGNGARQGVRAVPRKAGLPHPPYASIK
jgi:hypothetical protein